MFFLYHFRNNGIILNASKSIIVIILYPPLALCVQCFFTLSRTNANEINTPMCETPKKVNAKGWCEQETCDCYITTLSNNSGNIAVCLHTLRMQHSHRWAHDVMVYSVQCTSSRRYAINVQIQMFHCRMRCNMCD